MTHLDESFPNSFLRIKQLRSFLKKKPLMWSIERGRLSVKRQFPSVLNVPMYREFAYL